MRRDQHAFAGAHCRRDVRVPVGQHARHGVFQALGSGQLGGAQACIARVKPGMAWIICRQRIGRNRIRAAPDQHLRVAVLRGGFGLVEALQCAVVALVQAPVLFNRQPQGINFFECDVEGLDGALEERGIGNIEAEPFFLEQPSGTLRFGDAGGCQVDISPAGEAVFEIPRRLTVAHQDNFVHGIVRNRGHSWARGARRAACAPRAAHLGWKSVAPGRRGG